MNFIVAERTLPLHLCFSREFQSFGIGRENVFVSCFFFINRLSHQSGCSFCFAFRSSHHFLSKFMILKLSLQLPFNISKMTKLFLDDPRNLGTFLRVYVFFFGFVLTNVCFLFQKLLKLSPKCILFIILFVYYSHKYLLKLEFETCFAS